MKNLNLLYGEFGMYAGKELELKECGRKWRNKMNNSIYAEVDKYGEQPHWEVDIEYDFAVDCYEEHDTYYHTFWLDSESEAIDTVQDIVARIAKENREGKNPDGLFIINVSITFKGDLAEDLLKGAAWDDLKEG